MKLRIAVVQFDIRQLKPEENLRRAEEFIRKASSSKANIIVFPEYSMTGPIEGLKFADSKHRFRNHFQHLARKYRIDLVPGSFIEEESSGAYNTTYYIDSMGKIKSRHRKVHLWQSEKRLLKPGRRIWVFDTAYGKVGLAICWDLVFPELLGKMAKKGVDLVICPSYWCRGDAGKGLKYDADSEIKFVDSLCVSAAFGNEIALVFCNAAGVWRRGKCRDSLIGHSQIAIPFKGALKRLDHNREAMFIQEIDTAVLKAAEQTYGIRNELKKRIRH